MNFNCNGDAANTTRWNDNALLLAQRLRRWPNIKTSSVQRVVFAGELLLLHKEENTAHKRYNSRVKMQSNY